MREIQSMYDVSFVKLSERFFKGQPWPPVDAIAELVDHDHVFCMLYKVSGSSADEWWRYLSQAPALSGASYCLARWPFGGVGQLVDSAPACLQPC